MADRLSPPDAIEDESGELTLLGLGAILLRSRRMIAGVAVAGGIIGLAAGLLSHRLYVASTTFIPQGSDNSSANSGVALAASQFGIRLPASGGVWGPPLYVELTRTRTFLEPIVNDTFTVAEEGNRRASLMDLLEIKGASQAQRNERAATRLRSVVAAAEDKKINSVKIAVTTRWPSVSLALTQRIMAELDRFMLSTRKSQASAERQFAETQALEAERELRAAEDTLLDFLARNKAIGANSAVDVNRERLQRKVGIRQQVYASLVQSREDARIREVRDTPVITVIEAPHLPVEGQPRNSAQKAILGAFIAGLLGALIAFARSALAGEQKSGRASSREFFELVNEVKPRFLTRRA